MTSSPTGTPSEQYIRSLISVYLSTPTTVPSNCSYFPAPYTRSSDSPCFQFPMSPDATSPASTFSNLPALIPSPTRADDFEALAIWDAILLSPQYADRLDSYFREKKDTH